MTKHTVYIESVYCALETIKKTTMIYNIINILLIFLLHVTVRRHGIEADIFFCYKSHFKCPLDTILIAAFSVRGRR